MIFINKYISGLCLARKGYFCRKHQCCFYYDEDLGLNPSPDKLLSRPWVPRWTSPGLKILLINMIKFLKNFIQKSLEKFLELIPGDIPEATHWRFNKITPKKSIRKICKFFFFQRISGGFSKEIGIRKTFSKYFCEIP